MPSHKRNVYAMILLTAIIVSAVLIYHFQPNMTNRNGSSSPHAQGLNNEVNQAGVPTFELNQNFTALSVNSGSNVTGTAEMNIIEADPIRVYLDDLGINTTQSTLPSGLSFSVTIDGQTVNALPLSLPLSLRQSAPSIATRIGTTDVQYTVSTSNVPYGTYDIKLDFQSWLNNETVRGYSATYEIALTVNPI